MGLIDDLLELLEASGVDDRTVDLAFAAMAGSEALGSALNGESVDRPQPRAPDPPQVAAAYLSSIDVAGFRGVGEPARLEVPNGPGLTVVVGRNGSGKSSFAEALEVLLTGDSFRWRNKPVEWKQGWRNLHSGAGARVAATFNVEGAAGPTSAFREWDDAAKDVGDSITVVAPHGGKHTDLAGFGWADAIDLHRPMLSHPELGMVADDPSKLFDALSAVLGLDEVTAAVDLLRKQRLELEKPIKAARKRLKDEVLPELTAIDDERAASVASALGGKSWDLDAAAKVVAGSDARPQGLEALDSLSRLAVPGADDLMAVAARLESALERLATADRGEAGRSRRVVDLLRTALDEHADHGDQACPVCRQGTLDPEWRAGAEARIAEMTEATAEYDEASAEARAAEKAARDLIRAVPGELDDPPEGIDVTVLREAWRSWADLPEDRSHLVDHLRSMHPDLTAAAVEVAEAAAARRKELEDEWRPLAQRVSGWVETAREARSADIAAKELKQAEDAMADATVELRSGRFQPIADQAVALWGSLRLQSNVELTGVELSGTRTRRRVDLSVNVDGTDSSALGVVSQGEINCLALSLFFPRVMLPDSPFRFIVIDDPVQAMDPSRVDGLAKVFSQVAETRQLVVFTHDDRLPAALHRLSLAHTALEVTRRPRSVVDVRRNIDPVDQYFLDARAVERDESLPDTVAGRVVPGFCRSGLEAACMEAVRRRRIGRGDAHLAVERELSEAKRTTALLALALFDDPSQGSRVLGEINRKWGKGAADAYQDAQRGSHKGFSGSLRALTEETQKLAAELRALP